MEVSMAEDWKLMSNVVADALALSASSDFEVSFLNKICAIYAKFTSPGCPAREFSR
jgi:hypothetical protein